MSSENKRLYTEVVHDNGSREVVYEISVEERMKTAVERMCELIARERESSSFELKRAS